MTPQEFRYLQSLPYEEKVEHATIKARAFRDWAELHGKDICVSIGGLDSITLYYFLRRIGVYATPASVSVLEDKSIQRIHNQIPGLVKIKPYKTKVQVLNELGFPVISKGKAAKIQHLQTPNNPKQTFIHAIMTGDMGEQGHFQHSDKIKLPDKWIELFGGLYQEHRPDLCCKCAPFKVSPDCCKWMKERPAQDWQKENNMIPYLGLMASEGGQRELGLVKNGCNYYGKTTIRSCPFAIFMRQDLLRLSLEIDGWWKNGGGREEAEHEFGLDPEIDERFTDTIVPEIYGEIQKSPGGVLFTTEAQRTGCQMCGFGIHIEPRPHRFDRLYQRNPKEWDFWMKRCCTDENGEKFGWGRVLDWIGVRWTPETLEQDVAAQSGNVAGQMSLFDAEDAEMDEL